MSNNLHLTGSLRIDQGATYLRQAVLYAANGSPFDLTGFTASAQLRHAFSDTSASASFTCSVTTPATSGTLTWGLHYRHSTMISASCYRWDLEVNSPSLNETYRIFEGVAEVSPEVTK